MSKRLTIEEMDAIASSQGGYCLAVTYVNNRSKLRWRCRVGHEWEAVPRTDKWCPECGNARRGKKRITIAMMREVAIERGGDCLSEDCSNNASKLRFRCAEGHEWVATPRNIRRGHWCQECYNNHRRGKSKKKTLRDMRNLALDRGGECISEIYFNTATPLMWRCAEGHEWSAVPHDVRSGTWCPHCAGKRHTIDDMKRIAEGRGGCCLSHAYEVNSKKLKWKCSEGHIWWATLSNIHKGRWCPVCGRKNSGLKQRLDLSEMKKTAIEKGGRCLSEKYEHGHAKLLWECSKGHRWEATPMHVKNGDWCRQCWREGWFKREERCREILERLLGLPFPNKKLESIRNPKTGRKLEIDCFNEDKGIAVEVHGEQHYRWLSFFHMSYKEFENLKYRDKIKEKRCGDLGYTFITVPYTVKYDELEIYINTKLLENGIALSS